MSGNCRTFVAPVYVWAWNDNENFTGGMWPGVELTNIVAGTVKANANSETIYNLQGVRLSSLFYTQTACNSQKSCNFAAETLQTS